MGLRFKNQREFEAWARQNLQIEPEATPIVPKVDPRTAELLARQRSNVRPFPTGKQKGVHPVFKAIGYVVLGFLALSALLVLFAALTS